jgi:biotin-(acetyl-CoA carboxylase) ligase
MEKELLITEELQKQSPWKSKVHFFETVTSTNDLLLELAETGVPEGTVVIANRQTGGRGRFHRPWSSPSGMGLWMSLLLRLPIEKEMMRPLSQLAPVSLCDAFVKLGINVPLLQIKPPNDLLIAGKKVAGVLVETRRGSKNLYSQSTETANNSVVLEVASRRFKLPVEAEAACTSEAGNPLELLPSTAAKQLTPCSSSVSATLNAGSRSFAVVGIGLNIAQGLEDFPPELREKATSLALAGFHITHRNQLISALIHCLYERYQELHSDPQKLHDAWDTAVSPCV